MALRTFLGALALATSGCALVTSLDGLTGDGTKLLVEAGADAPSVDAAPSDATGDEPSPPVDVAGAVVDEYGNAVVGAFVAIGGVTRTTDSNGRFTVAAPPIYDVDIVFPILGTVNGKRVRRYSALTSRTPTLEIPATKREAKVTFAVTGVTYPLAIGESVTTTFAPSSPTMGFESSYVSANGVQNTVRWYGAPTGAGKATGWDFTTGSNGLPSVWKGRAIAAFSVSEGVPSSIALSFTSAPPTATFTGTLDYGTAIYRQMGLTFAVPGEGRTLLTAKFGTTSFTAPLPIAAIVGIYGFGNTTSGTVGVWKHGLTSSASVANLKLPSGDFTFLSPTEGATNVDTTSPFHWSAVPSALYFLHVTCGGSPYSYEAEVVTTETTVTLPSPSALGITLPSKDSCSTELWTAGPIASADDLTSPLGWSRRLGFRDGTTDGVTWAANGHSFTTK